MAAGFRCDFNLLLEVLNQRTVAIQDLREKQEHLSVQTRQTVKDLWEAERQRPLVLDQGFTRDVQVVFESSMRQAQPFFTSSPGAFLRQSDSSIIEFCPSNTRHNLTQVSLRT